MPPPQPGSTGPDPAIIGPILTPYGGIYPQPLTNDSYPPQRAQGLINTQSLAMRPVRKTRIITLSLDSQATGNQSQIYSNKLPFTYTIRDVLFYATAFGGSSYWNVTWSWTGNDSSINTLNGSPQSIFAPFCNTSGVGVGSLIFTASSVMQFYDINIFVDTRDSILIFNNINNTGGTAGFAVAIVIEISPDTETVP